MSATLHCFPGQEDAGERLAQALAIPCAPVSIRHFPDGESLVRVSETAPTALLFCSLDDPDTRIVQLLLAASALRQRGAARVHLIAPYLGYMRQDRAFAPGEAVSQQVIGALIATTFDGLVTVDPHLHRTPRLEDVVPGIAAITVSASSVIASHLKTSAARSTVLVGPDSESRQWVEAIARPLDLAVLVGRKDRKGDRTVEIVLEGIEHVAGRPVVLVDDLISTGSSLIRSAEQLYRAGATSVSAVATHCLASPDDLAALAAAGIAPIVATDTVAGPCAALPVAPALAAAIRAGGMA